ncbi:hypothetical protein [Streptomyces sp. MNP-20]|uniref:hypothetical protein n=1 Tax=Streptomyces sp. MNP-20 TaxID=2721165 RepID=UPI001556ADC4|nr:hypothetical protein [Streptomyces sp. MNP-20]
MTAHRRTALVCRTTAVLLAAGAAYTGHQGAPVPTVALAYGTLLLAWCGRREAAADRRARVHARRAELAARPSPRRPLTPRPPAGPSIHDGTPLNPHETAAFCALVAHYDDRSAA